ncbi:MAG: hypothetical protein FWF75_10260 [Propionibacteriaceae bacterium]|nr:hypothetical protein [Propionibacteriaceae bacterium]
MGEGHTDGFRPPQGWDGPAPTGQPAARPSQPGWREASAAAVAAHAAAAPGGQPVPHESGDADPGDHPEQIRHLRVALGLVSALLVLAVVALALSRVPAPVPAPVTQTVTVTPAPQTATVTETQTPVGVIGNSVSGIRFGTFLIPAGQAMGGFALTGDESADIGFASGIYVFIGATQDVTSATMAAATTAANNWALSNDVTLDDNSWVARTSALGYQAWCVSGTTTTEPLNADVGTGCYYANDAGGSYIWAWAPKDMSAATMQMLLDSYAPAS